MSPETFAFGGELPRGQPSPDAGLHVRHCLGKINLGTDWRGTSVKGLMRLLPGYFRRRRCAEARLLQTTLENIGEGLSVFDSRGRLIAWNTRFCELLELPPDLPVGAPLHEVLMLQAARGDFGRDDPSAEVARRLESFYRHVPT